MAINLDYHLLAYATRYLFLVLTLIILFALIAVSYKEYKNKKEIRGIISAYTGYLEIVGGAPDYLGDQFGVGEITTIGSGNNADVIIEGADVEPLHAKLLATATGIAIEPQRGADVYVNGARVQRARALKTGDVISVGNVDLALHLKRKRIGYDA